MRFQPKPKSQGKVFNRRLQGDVGGPGRRNNNHLTVAPPRGGDSLQSMADTAPGAKNLPVKEAANVCSGDGATEIVVVVAAADENSEA